MYNGSTAVTSSAAGAYQFRARTDTPTDDPVAAIAAETKKGSHSCGTLIAHKPELQPVNDRLDSLTDRI